MIMAAGASSRLAAPAIAPIPRFLPKKCPPCCSIVKFGLHVHRLVTLSFLFRWPRAGALGGGWGPILCFTKLAETYSPKRASLPQKSQTKLDKFLWFSTTDYFFFFSFFFHGMSHCPERWVMIWAILCQKLHKPLKPRQFGFMDHRRL